MDAVQMEFRTDYLTIFALPFFKAEKSIANGCNH